jgi:hypothetical protein
MNIIHFVNGKLIMQAESKLLFIAFCFEYQNYIESLKNNSEYFYSAFPIQVDATCNGYQHLALLLGDNSLAKELNLSSFTFDSAPQDFYSFIGLKLKELFGNNLLDINNNTARGKEIENLKSNYERLYQLDIHRSLIKKPIMTKPYNATHLVTVDYILEDFVIEPDSVAYMYKPKEERGDIWYTYKKDSNIRVTEKDMHILISSIDYLIYNKFPKLTKLSAYFKGVANYCNALNLGIP